MNEDTTRCPYIKLNIPMLLRPRHIKEVAEAETYARAVADTKMILSNMDFDKIKKLQHNTWRAYGELDICSLGLIIHEIESLESTKTIGIFPTLHKKIKLFRLNRNKNRLLRKIFHK